MFICMPKILFITHFFIEILHFKESCKLIGWLHFSLTQEPTFWHIWDWWWNINNNIFILDCFQEKLISKFFKKKKKYFGAIFDPFCPNLAKINFPGKKACQFLNIPNIYYHAKNQKKTNEPFLSRIPNWWRDRRM